MRAKCRNCGRYFEVNGDYVYCSECLPLIEARSRAKKMGDEWKTEVRHLDFLLKEEEKREFCMSRCRHKFL